MNDPRYDAIRFMDLDFDAGCKAKAAYAAKVAERSRQALVARSAADSAALNDEAVDGLEKEVMQGGR